MWALLIAASYLLGSVSFSVIFVRVLHDVDIRSQGSGNAGATNVLRVSGWRPAVAVLVLDVGKGATGVLVARALGAPGIVIGMVAVAAIVGHVFPVFHHFRGGKGVATVTGAMGALAPVPTLMSALLFFLVAATTRYVALASVSGCVSFPMMALIAGRLGWSEPPPVWLLVSSGTMAILIAGKHWGNLVRIRRGNEWRLGDARQPEPER